MSIARRHYQRTTAAAAGAEDPSASVPPEYANQYELMLAQLAEHRRVLHGIQSIERKAEAKRKMLPEYTAWVAGALESASGRQDDVLMTVMVWAIDVGDYAAALEIADYAIEHGLTLPDQYKRDVATLVAEEIADKALSPGGNVGIDVLAHVEASTATRDMPDEVRAKVHKALGLALEATDDQAEALAHLNRALALNERVGAKKDIERIERTIKKAGTAG